MFRQQQIDLVAGLEIQHHARWGLGDSSTAQ
jgi:hypothetical protein